MITTVMAAMMTAEKASPVQAMIAQIQDET